jgi:hypothetical protein
MEFDFTVSPNEYGYIITIPDKEIDLYGYSEDFIIMINFCRSLGVKYIDLDRDAGTLDQHLNVNDW